MNWTILASVSLGNLKLSGTNCLKCAPSSSFTNVRHAQPSVISFFPLVLGASKSPLVSTRGVPLILKWKRRSLSRVRLFVTPWTIQSLEFSRPEYWSGKDPLSLLQGIFPTQGSNPGVPHCGQILYQLSHKGSPRILEWVAYPFSSGSSRPRNWTEVSCIAGRFFINWALREAQLILKVICILSFFPLYGFLLPISHQHFLQYSCYLKLLMDNKLHDVEHWRKMGKWQT